MLIHSDKFAALTETDSAALSNGYLPQNGRFLKKMSAPTSAVGGRRGNIPQIFPPTIQSHKHSCSAADGARNAKAAQQTHQMLTANDGTSTGAGSSGGSVSRSSVFEMVRAMFKSSNAESGQGMDSTDESDFHPNALRTSRSNPDISCHIHPQTSGNLPHGLFSGGGHLKTEQAVKIYKSDQAFRYLTVYPETTAKNIVQLALQVQKFRFF